VGQVEHLRHPDLVRLIAWLRLERRPTGRLTDSADDKPRLSAIALAQAAGRVRPGAPHDLFALVLAMACTWSPASGLIPRPASAGRPVLPDRAPPPPGAADPPGPRTSAWPGSNPRARLALMRARPDTVG
jgi:hypothetical protein